MSPRSTALWAYFDTLVKVIEPAISEMAANPSDRLFCDETMHNMSVNSREQRVKPNFKTEPTSQQIHEDQAYFHVLPMSVDRWTSWTTWCRSWRCTRRIWRIWWRIEPSNWWRRRRRRTVYCARCCRGRVGGGGLHYYSVATLFESFGVFGESMVCILQFWNIYRQPKCIIS